jgi:hypothetical protein
MKKYVCFSIIVLILSFSTQSSYGNSGPVYWTGYPNYELMSVDDNSPIEVTRETLEFDLTKSEKSSFTISGTVKAAYQMRNTTEVDHSVQMAFPFISSVNQLDSENIKISADGQSVPYEIYFGDVVGSHGSPFQEESSLEFEFSDIVEKISQKTYQAKHFTLESKGTLYRFQVRPTSEERIHFSVEFQFNPQKTKVLTYGFDRYERSEDKIRIASGCMEPQILEIFVMGEDLDFNVQSFSDGSLEEKTDLFDYDLSVQEIDFKNYFNQYIETLQMNYGGTVRYKPQIFELYCKALDVSFVRNEGFSSEHDLLEQGQYQRIMTFIYTVDFSKQSEKSVEVSYSTFGTMDKTKTAKPIYSFQYILNPAEHWKDFKDLSVKILTPKEAPYLVDSSVSFEKTGEREYTAFLSSLPDQDLRFSLYEDEQITLIDRTTGKLYGYFGYATPVVVGGIVLIAAIIILLSFSRMIKKKE